MKRLTVLFMIVMLLGVTACAEDLQVQIIDGGTGMGEIVPQEIISIENICDVQLLGAVAGSYAMSIAAYERPEDELFLTPAASGTTSSGWGSCERYKYELNSAGKVGYIEMYVDIGAALQASSDEYQLLDIRMSILNRMLSPMEVAETIQIKVTYDENYVFESPVIWMEQADTLGNPNEWLAEASPIPMLVERTTHFIFEVPEIVTTSAEPLEATITINGEEYTYAIR